MSKLEDFVLAKQEEWLAIVEKCKPAEDKIESYTSCAVLPPLIVRWIPIFGNMRKRYLLVLTDKHLLIIRTKLLKIEYIAHQTIPLDQVRVLSARTGLWDRLVLQVPGNRYKFSEVFDQDFIPGLQEALNTE